MNMTLILLVFAFVLFVLAAYIAKTKGALELTLGFLGLACWVVTLILGGAGLR